MDRAQYLQAMRDQAPKEFNRLAKAGQLDNQANLKVREANRMLQELLKDAPKDSRNQPTDQARREAEEYVRAEILSFPAGQEDEENALLGDRPIVSPERTTP